MTRQSAGGLSWLRKFNPSALSCAVRRAIRSSPPFVCMTAGVFSSIGAALTTALEAGLFPPEFELSSLLPENGGDGSAGIVLNGIDAGDWSSEAAGSAGDVNGDGIDDIIVGALLADPPERFNAGESYVVFGRAAAQGAGFPAVTELSSLLPQNGGDGSTGFVVNGIHPMDYSGTSVASAGDVNGDGIGDFIIGADFADPGGRSSAGATYVVFGRNAVMGSTFPPLLELASLLPANGGNGSHGFVLNGIVENDRSGEAIAPAGDLNNDGIGDIVIGAFNGGTNDAGQGYVVFGRDTARVGDFPPEFELSSLLPANGGDGSDGFVLNGIRCCWRTGDVVGAAGDVNGDDVGDLIISAPQALPSPDFRHFPGQIYVVFGRGAMPGEGFPAVFELSTLLPEHGGDGSVGFVLNGAYDDRVEGWAAGDLNGDGIGDLFLGSERQDSYVVFGRDAEQSNGFPAVIELSSLDPANGGDGTTGFVVRAVVVAAAGRSPGDVNGDGIDDLALASVLASPGDRTSAGQSYVVFGRDATQSSFPTVLELSSLLPDQGGDGSMGFVLNGINAHDYSFMSLAAGDFDGDGIGDLLGSAYADPGGRDGAGQTYVVFGRGVPDDDGDGDGVGDSRDLCPGTSIPEFVPIAQLRARRYALLDSGTYFDFGTPAGPVESDITTTSTGGCSCGQILARIPREPGEILFGCTPTTMSRWIQSVPAL